MRVIGLEGVTHHALRHTDASAMVAAGISLRVVQDIGGWSTLRMLERYAHPSGAEMSRAVRVLTEYTTGTKTGTVPKNEKDDSKPADAASVVKSAVTKRRPNGIRTRVLALKGPRYISTRLGWSASLSAERHRPIIATPQGRLPTAIFFTTCFATRSTTDTSLDGPFAV
jgi:hypothetical protein